MEVEKESQGTSLVQRCSLSINDLPDEVLEYILSLISPYKDMKECMLVCRRWFQSVKNVSRLMSINLTKAIKNLDVTWETVTPVEMAPSITKRYSHSACYHDHSMYVFGGCTSSSTTFNDLWRLDLTKRQWVRPLTMGTYPSPKACASMVHYKNGLVLFGGWTHPSPYPLYQAWRLFYELHIYCIKSNRWTCINTTSHPPAMAGHSASVHGDVMVIFGGLMADSMGHYSISNDVWCFDLENQEWKKQEISDPKPSMRYGQSQISLDKDHILIMGGCGGSHLVLNDIWLLKMQGNVWQWKEIQIGNSEWSAPHMWCHPACKIGEQVVVLSRHPGGNTMPWTSWKSSVSPGFVLAAPSGEDAVYAFPRRYSEENIHLTAPIDRDLNVNGRRGSFKSRPGRSSDSGATSGDATRSVRARLNPPCPDSKPSSSSNPPSDNDNARNSPPGRPSLDEDKPDGSQSRLAQRYQLREKHLECLRRIEEKLRKCDRWRNGSKNPENQDDNKNQGSVLFPKPYKIAMAMYVLDISKVLESCYVTWLALRPCPMPVSSPEETILYSLVAGRGELIMFGGIQKDAMSVTSQVQSPSQNNVSNSLHFISAPRGVI